jgi:hypothetical protein
MGKCDYTPILHKKTPCSVFFLQQAPWLGGSCEGKTDGIAPLLIAAAQYIETGDL